MAASPPATRMATSASTRPTPARQSAIATWPMSSCSAATSSRTCGRSCAPRATAASSAATSQCGSRSELEDEEREQTHEHEVAGEDPPGQHLAPVVDGAVRQHEAVPLGAGENERDDEDARRKEAGRRNERDEPREVLRRENLVERDERGHGRGTREHAIAMPAQIQPRDVKRR